MRSHQLVLSSALVGLAGLGLGCSSNGSTDPGEGTYGIYRVALSDAKLGKTCTQPPVDFSKTETTIRDGQTLIVYGFNDEGTTTLFLDTGSDVLDGGFEPDDSFKFQGKIIRSQGLDGRTYQDSDHDGIDDNIDMMVDADADGKDDKGIDDEVDVDADGEDDRTSDDLVDANSDGKDDNEVVVPPQTTVTTTSTVTVSMMDLGDVVTGTSKTLSEGKCAGPLCTNFQAEKCEVTVSFQGVRLEGATLTVPLPSESNGSPQP